MQRCICEWWRGEIDGESPPHLGHPTRPGANPCGWVRAQEAAKKVDCRRLEAALIDIDCGVRCHTLVNLAQSEVTPVGCLEWANAMKHLVHDNTKRPPVARSAVPPVGRRPSPVHGPHQLRRDVLGVQGAKRPRSCERRHKRAVGAERSSRTKVTDAHVTPSVDKHVVGAQISVYKSVPQAHECVRCVW